MTPAPTGFLDPPSARYAWGLTDAFHRALGDALAGVYLYGSAVVGDFVPRRSDVDLVVVVHRPLAPGEAERTVDAVWSVPLPYGAKGLDLYLVTTASAGTPRPDPAYELQMLTFFDLLKVGGPASTDPRLSMHYVCCRRHASPLLGPHPRKVFAPITRAEYAKQLRRELFLSLSRDPHYRVLNGCRDWRFLEENLICSKLAGGEWAAPRLADPSLVEAALQWQRTGTGPPMDPVATDAFIERIALLLEEACTGVGQRVAAGG